MLALLPYVRPIVLLVGSNVFMTAAWYWHLRYKEVPLFYVIFISWESPLSNIAWLFPPIATATPSTIRHN